MNKYIKKRLFILLVAGVSAFALCACEKAQTLKTEEGNTSSEGQEVENTESDATCEAVVSCSEKLFKIWSDGLVENFEVKLSGNAHLESACIAGEEVLVSYYEENPTDYSATNYVVAKCAADGNVTEIFSQKEIYSRRLFSIDGDAYFNYYYYDLESNNKYVIMKYDPAEGTLVEDEQMPDYSELREIEDHYNANYDVFPAIELAKYGCVPVINFEDESLSLVDKDVKFFYTLPVDEAKFLDKKDDKLFYYVVLDKDAVDSAYEVHMRDIKTEEDVVLYTAKNPSGAFRYITSGIEGFTIAGDYAYFIMADETNDAWYKVNITEASPKLESCGTTIKEYDYTKYGRIEPASEVFKLEERDKIYFSYHIEKFVVDSSIKNADVINADLEEVHKIDLEEAQSDAAENKGMYEEYGTSDYDMPACYSEERVSEVKLLGGRYLQIIYNGYVYYGGAHGMPYFNYYLFDTETGERVTISDLYAGSDDEFAKIAMDIMVAKIQSGEIGELYPEYYEVDESELREKLVDYMRIDREGYFTEDSYVIVTEPYALAPYASGFIETEIPLESIGITF